MAYSMDYRRSVIRSYDESGSSAEVAEQHGCSESWVRKLVQQLRERGTLEPLTTARHDDQRTYNDDDERTIRELIQSKPDATLAEVIEERERLLCKKRAKTSIKKIFNAYAQKPCCNLLNVVIIDAHHLSKPHDIMCLFDRSRRKCLRFY